MLTLLYSTLSSISSDGSVVIDPLDSSNRVNKNYQAKGLSK